MRQTSYMVGNNRVVVGYYSYLGPDGKIYTTQYTADQHGYRASGSHLPVQDGAVQPLPFVPHTPGPGHFISSTLTPYVSSTPAPFVSSTPFASPSPFNVPTSSTPYRGPFDVEYNPTTSSPIISSSTPIASTLSPFPRRPHFPLFQGYAYTNPRINTPYSVVSQQTPAPIFFPSSTEQPVNRFSYITAPSNINSRITTTLATPPFMNNYNSVSSSTSSPFEADRLVQFKEYIPPVSIVSSTPRPFNGLAPNQPDTIFITPKPSYNQPRLPNSLSINQNLLPPHLSVSPLNSSPEFQNSFRSNTDFINNPSFEFNNQVRPLPRTVAPLAVTNLNFRKKRNFGRE